MNKILDRVNSARMQVFARLASKKLVTMNLQLLKTNTVDVKFRIVEEEPEPDNPNKKRCTMILVNGTGLTLKTEGADEIVEFFFKRVEDEENIEMPFILELENKYELVVRMRKVQVIISVKSTTTPKDMEMEFDITDSIGEIIAKLSPLVGIPVGRIRLIKRINQEPIESGTFADHDIQHNTIIDLFEK